jgi:hypothetical protein
MTKLPKRGVEYLQLWNRFFSSLEVLKNVASNLIAFLKPLPQSERGWVRGVLLVIVG